MKRMVAAVGVVNRRLNGKLYILVCQRICPKCKEADNKWELPGGTVEPNENLFQTVEREILEETGIVCKSVKLLQSHTHKTWLYLDENRTVLAFGILCKYLGGEITNGNNVKNSQWIMLDKALDLDLLFGIKDKILEAIQIIKR